MDKKKPIYIIATVAAIAAMILGGVLLAVMMGPSGNGGTIHVEVPPIWATSVPTQITETTTQQQTGPTTTEPPVTEPPTTEPPATEPPATEPPVTDPPATEPPATDPPVTEPPETQPPTTGPTQYLPNGNELIGTLYTRDQLAAIDGTRKGYGAGKSVNGSRPAYASNAQRHTASCIMPTSLLRTTARSTLHSATAMSRTI